MNSDVAPTSADAADDILGWYRLTTSAEPVRVRMAVEGGALNISTLSGRLVARWSLDRLENRVVPVLGETWSIGDSQLPMPFLELENDRDYRTIQGISANLRPPRARWWQLLSFSFVESGGGGVLVLVLGSLGIYWLWQNLPFGKCIATQPGGILFLKCLIIDHFMR